ncbi:MAG: PAS domain S-box protein, partial [bacterium]
LVDMTVARDDEDGLPVCRVTIADLTGQKQTEEALREFRTAVEQSVDSIALTDLNGHIRFVNESCARMHGYSADQLIGRHLGIFHTKEQLETEVNPFTERLLETGSGEGEVGHARQDGTTFPAWMSTTVVMDANRKPFGLLGIARDITGQKQTEETLRASQQIIEGILNAIPVRIFWKDKNFVYLGCNTGFARDAGFADPKDIVGKDDYQMGWRDQADLYRSDDRQVIENDCPRLFIEESQTTHEGNTLTLLTSKIPLRDSMGKINGILGTYMDITEHKREVEALRENESRFRRISDIISDIAFSCTMKENGKYLIDWITGAAELITGYTLEELKAHGCWRFLVLEEDLPLFDRHVTGVMPGSSDTCELKIRHRNGEIRWVCSFAQCITEPDKASSFRLYGGLIDITDRKRAEERLRYQYEMRQAILDNIPVMVALLDREGRHQFINHCWQSTLGWSLEEMMHKDVLAEIYPDPECREHVLDHINRAEGRWGDFKTRTHDGRVLDTSWINVQLSDGSNIGIGIDVSERKRAAEEKLKMDRQIQQTQKLESLGVLSTVIAHDFNNILMAILGYADLSLNGLSPLSPIRDYVTQITKASHRGAELCRQMLAYTGKGSFALERIDLRVLIEEMSHLLTITVSKKAVFNLRLERGLPLIQADPSQIRQVIMNLIINASEAISEQSGVISITTGTVRCDADHPCEIVLGNDLTPGCYAYIEVADTGCGMDAETKARVFDPFFTTKFTGHGLGLSAILGIIKAHKGAIEVSSEPGKGTTFKVFFPALEISKAGAGVDAAAAAADPKWRGSGTILLVDDEKILRTVGGDLLDLLGFTVLTAANGRDAVNIYRERGAEISLVLMDLTMPQMNGIEAFDELHRLNPDVRVVMVSGYSTQDVASRYARKGLAGVIQKPYTLSELSEKLRSVFEAGV